MRNCEKEMNFRKKEEKMQKERQEKGVKRPENFTYKSRNYGSGTEYIQKK